VHVGDPPSQSFSLYWVGLAAATGLLIDIPVVTRSIARAMLYPDTGLDLDMMLILDAGNHPSHRTGTVQHYEADWWTKDEAPRIGDYLNFNRLASCLSFHAQVCNESIKSFSTGTGTDKPVAGHERMAPEPIIHLSCNRCMRYRGVAIDALQNIHSLRAQIQQQEATLEQQRLLIMRRASGFNKLYEAAVIKDTEVPVTTLAPAETEQLAPSVTAHEDVPAPQPSAPQPSAPESSAPESSAPRQLRARKHFQQERRGTAAQRAQSKKAKKPTKLTNAQLAEILRQHAVAERDTLTRHPSLKWTWGEDLDRGDIRQLFRGADRNYELPHSAYDYSLKTGRFDGEDSDFASIPRTENWQHSPIAEQKVISELDSDEAPIHFGRFPLRRVRSVVPEGNLPIGGEVLPSFVLLSFTCSAHAQME
jgi:hypothetical protein